MRFNNILIKHIRFSCLLIACIVLSVSADGQPQKEKKTKQLLDITMKVVDEQGNPVPKANVVIGEGITHTATDNNGAVTFKGYSTDVVTITVIAFEKKASSVAEILANPTVTLQKAKIHMTSGDIIEMPYSSIKRRNITGPDLVVKGDYFEKYPSSDIRNALTGITSGWDIRELNGSPGLSSQEGLMRYSGLSNAMGAVEKFAGMPLVIVDGLVTEINEAPLNPTDIESATLIKGILGTAMYGPVGAGGILLINTKSGVKNEKMLNIDVESGVSTIDRMPSWVNGEQYAQLNNQARIGSGLQEKYDQAALDQIASNNPEDLWYPNLNFRDLALKNTRNYNKVNLSSSGGNDMVQYFSTIGVVNEGDIYKIGSSADYNRIDTRQNVNVKVNDQINVKFGFYGNMTFRRSPNYGYDSDFTSEDSGSNPALSLIEFSPFLADMIETPQVAFPLHVTDPSTGASGYGVSSSYNQNPIGGLTSQGFYTDRSRTGVSNVAFNYDAGNFIKGLKSTTYFGFNISDMVRIGKANDYAGYTVAKSSKTGADTLLRYSGHTLVTQADMAKLMDYYFQRYTFYENLSYDRTFGNSTIQSTLSYNQGKAFFNGIEEPQRTSSLVWSALYSFKDKYSIQAVVNYAGSQSFSKELRYKAFPSVGASWVISDENFMSNFKPINYLKLRAQYGILGNENFLPPFYYRDRWSQNNSGSAFGPQSTASTQWFGSTTDANVYRNSPQRIGNPDLSWELRKEFNAGFDALLMKQKLAIDVTYYNILSEGIISQVNNVIPFVAGLQGARPWYNWNATRYNVLSLELKFSDVAGPFFYSIGGNAATSVGTRIKYDEPNYRFGYQTRTGKAADAIFGMVYLGRFSSDDEALITPQVFDEELHTGDLKYKDMNNDGFVDDNDQSMIGNASPRLTYSLNATIRYKNFELFVLGAGRAFYDIPLTNAWYQNGWGDNNYSTFVLNNIDGAYPRLTYYRVNNNFQMSEYWLAKGDYFKIQNVEVSYTIPASALKLIGSRGIKIYVRGANLLTFSQLKDVDPETINGILCGGVTTYPLYKTFTAGVKLNF